MTAARFAELNPSCAPWYERTTRFLPSRISLVSVPPQNGLSAAKPRTTWIDGQRPGTARPFPPWRLRGGPDALPVDQYSERYAMIFPPTEYPMAQHRARLTSSALSA